MAPPPPARVAVSRARARARHLRRLVVAVVAATVAVTATVLPAWGQDDASGPVVDVLPLRGHLDPPVADAVRDLLADAAAHDSALVVLQVDGRGGLSVDADGLVEAVVTAPVPVVVFVSPQQGVEAAAGGLYGLLWARAPLRAVSLNARVGPLAPVDLAAPNEALDDGVRARLADLGLGELEDTAVAAEDLPDEAVDAVAANVASLLVELDGREVTSSDGTTVTLSFPRDEVEIRLHSLGLLSRLLHAAATPAFIYLLLVVGLGMLAFELFQPGFGVAGVAGLVMLPFAVFGLTVLPVTWWALALLLVGLGLFVVDAAVAGLGPVTAAATATFGAGSWWVFGTDVLRVPPVLVIAMTLAALAFFVVVLTVVLRAQAGPEGVDVSDLVGRHGIVRSVLNPEGHVFIDDALWRARVEDDVRLRVGTPITVTGVEGALLVVAPFDPETAGAAAAGGTRTPEQERG